MARRVKSAADRAELQLGRIDELSRIMSFCVWCPRCKVSRCQDIVFCQSLAKRIMTNVMFRMWSFFASCLAEYEESRRLLVRFLSSFLRAEPLSRPLLMLLKLCHLARFCALIEQCWLLKEHRLVMARGWGKGFSVCRKVGDPWH